LFGASEDNVAIEVLTYLQLTRGTYRMGVNSDDGFQVSAGLGTADRFGIVLGSFGTGRGAADTVFDFYVAADGFYPFRLLTWEGNGGASAEWFAVDLSNGQRTLINGTGAGAVRAFQTGSGRAHISSILPANGYIGAPVRPTIAVQFANGRTSVKAGSVSIVLDGATVLSGQSGPSVNYLVPADLPYASAHTGSIIWTETTVPEVTWTNTFTFSVGPFTPDVLPAGTFWIESEDYNYGSGQHNPVASTMPYTGDAYFGLEGVLGTDFQDTPVADGAITEYRMIKDINGAAIPIPISTGRYGIDRPGPVDMVTNYRIGWTGAGDWYNYTRNVPLGVYNAFAALSQDVGTMSARLEQVTSAANTPNQTVVTLGTFTAPASGAWGDNDLVPMQASDGTRAVFKVRSQPITLRFNTISGDFDWFALAPATGVPAKVTSATPVDGASVPRDSHVRATIEDFSTTVATTGVRLFFDGADVTSSASITKAADIVTVDYNPGQTTLGQHSYRLEVTDSGGARSTNSASFTSDVRGTTGQFSIEAEDFDHSGGQFVAGANTMPYTGNGYNGQGAVFGVDYQSTEGLTAADGWTPVYRTAAPITAGTQAPLVNNIDGTLGRDRGGSWQMTANYRIGWTGGDDWYNYTRNEVWAALSHGDVAATMAGRLAVVSPTSTNVLGVFQAPATGGWGSNALVPMQGPSTNGIRQVVSLTGQQTLRFYTPSGDFDYFLLVPGTSQPQFSPPTLSGGSMTLGWTGTGTLEEATAITGPWGDAPSQANPQQVPVGTTGQKFYRIAP
jgi:hypothetical protein